MADVFQESTSTDRAGDEAAIRELLRCQQNGWDSGDPTLYATAEGWMLAASQNTTRRRLAETLLQKLASRDKLTGLDFGNETDSSFDLSLARLGTDCLGKPHSVRTVTPESG